LGIPDGGTDRPVALPGDLPVVEHAIRQIKAGVVVIDPLMAYLGGDVDSHRDQDIRRAMMPLAQLAESTGAAILIVRHLNKSGGRSAIYRGGGSIGIVGAARMGLLVARDPDDDDLRILAPTKSNLAGPAPALRWRLVGVGSGVARVEWLGEADVSADDLVRPQERDEEAGAVIEAVDWLRDRLVSGSAPARDLIRDAKADGIAERTLRRARDRLGVKATREGFPARTTWTISPARSATAAGQSDLGRSGDLGRTVENKAVSRRGDDCRASTANGDGAGHTGVEVGDDGELL
jgi:hypothetical protein